MQCVLSVQFEFLEISINQTASHIIIILFLLSIYILSNEKILSYIPKEYTYIHKALQYYKNIRVLYIVYKIILLLTLLLVMIGITFGIVYEFIHYI